MKNGPVSPRAKLVALAIGFAFGFFVVPPELSAADTKTVDRISLTAAPPPQRRPIRLDDIVSKRELHSPRLSPDGKRAAFIVQQGFRNTNSYRAALYVVATAGSAPPVKRLEEDSLSALDWTPDGKFITYLSARSGSLQLWRLPADGGAAELVFSHAPGPEETVMRRGYHPGDKTEVGVLSYRFSPSGKQIAFAAPGRPDPEKNKRLARRGILYDDETMSVQNILNDSWRHEPTGLWIYDIGAKTEKKVWESADEISGFAWSPDGARLAVSYAAPPVQKTTMIFFNQDLGILTLADRKFRIVSATEAVEEHPVWSPDGKSLAFESSLSEANTSLVVLDPATGARRELARGEIGVGGVRDLWWDRDRLLMELPTRGRARVGKSAIWSIPAAGGVLKKVSSGEESLSACAIVPGAADAVCIRQASMIPPDPALVHLADGSVRTLARINPELEGVKLSPIRELRWKNKYGDETNGYLIEPPARPAPLLVILYGFSGDFVAEAEWIASYPAQAFARDGFAVLMMNYPRYEDWVGRNYAKGSVAEGLSPLASMDAAIKMLAQQGIADPKRTGVLGWSYGCFLSEFAITHSDLFRVASAGAGGDYNPGIYALLGRRAFRDNYERVLGGPPYDDTLKNWQEFSPAFNANRTKAPVLMEFSPHEALFGLEMSAAFRRHGVPVEFVVYPEEGHIFTQPEHRYFSMQRNLDWFNFWLQGKERSDADGDTKQQYVRWSEMRRRTQESGRKKP